MYLQLKNLSKKFGSLTAVSDLSLDIKQGELISILGPSGCGKTTTLKMLGGFLEPDQGAIILDEKDITGLPAEKRPTATVFQNYALFPHMSVIDNITYGLKFKDIKRRKAYQNGLKMINQVGLNGYENKKISQLSGGEKQRVALGRALIMNPKVLLLDEPLSNLDAKLRIKMRKEIKELQDNLGITTIYVTHDQEEALSLSDRIVVMNKGEVKQIGIPRKIYSYPQNKFVADFIGRVNFISTDYEDFLIRPEDVELSADNGSIKGKIIQKQFRGSFATYFVETNGELIQADVLNRLDQNWPIKKEIFINLADDKKIKV